MSNRRDRIGPEAGKGAQVTKQQIPSGQRLVKHPGFSGDFDVAADEVRRDFVTLVEHNPLDLSQRKMKKELGRRYQSCVTTKSPRRSGAV
jgi:hypothetical protein